MEVLSSAHDNPPDCIKIWLKEIEKDGFHTFSINYDALEKYHNKNNEDFGLDSEEQFLVIDPFCEVSPEEVIKYEREDGHRPDYGLKGLCTAFLNSGFEMSGKWNQHRRVGPGLICGRSLEKMGVKSIWGKYKDGYLTGPGKAVLLDGDCTLEGNFTQGKLHGPVRGLTSRGNKSNIKNPKFKLHFIKKAGKMQRYRTRDKKLKVYYFLTPFFTPGKS